MRTNKVFPDLACIHSHSSMHYFHLNRQETREMTPIKLKQAINNFFANPNNVYILKHLAPVILAFLLLLLQSAPNVAAMLIASIPLVGYHSASQTCLVMLPLLAIAMFTSSYFALTVAVVATIYLNNHGTVLNDETIDSYCTTVAQMIGTYTTPMLEKLN